VYFDRVLDLVHALGAGERIGAVDVHGAGAADALAAGAAERQGRIDLVLDPDQGVENHRRTVVTIDKIGVDARVGVVVRIPAVDAERCDAARAGRALPWFVSGCLGRLWY